MGAIETIKEKLSKYPNLTYEQGERSLTVSPEDGFSVSLFENNPGYAVHFEGWHEEFSDQDEALNCFAFGLSDQCRLEIMKRGQFEYKWTLQHLVEGNWVEESSTGLMLVPFWRKKTVVYRQNNVIQG